jgi:hypothetical protein
MLATCGKMKNLKNCDRERIRSSTFARGPEPRWELKSVTVHSNGHSIVHDPQRGRHLPVDAESEVDILAWIQRNYEKARPQREPRFAIIVRRNSIRK